MSVIFDRGFIKASVIAAFLFVSLFVAGASSGQHTAEPLPLSGKFIDKYHGELQVPVLLVEFSDLKFRYSKADFELFLNQKGYSVDGATGSVKDYFDSQFDGRCTFVFNPSEILTLDKPFSFYGKNRNLTESGSDIRVGKMAYDACMLANEEFDFSKYDNDKDGTLDYLLVIYAGGDESTGAGSDHIWSKYGVVDAGHSGGLNLDGVNIEGFACTSEMASDGGEKDTIAGIGTFCHEFGHALGLPDLYDYNGQSECLWGRTSLMDRGCANNNGRTPPNLNVIERHILGLVNPEPLSEGFHRLLPLSKGGKCYRYDTEVEGEYFLFECREQTGWDEYIGGSGMLVYHIDSSFTSVGGVPACKRWRMYGNYANTVNSFREHQCADLIEADPLAVFSGPATPESEVARVFYPFGNSSSFTPASTPPFKSWAGVSSEISLADIRYMDGEVSFTVFRNEFAGLPFVRDLKVDEFQDAAILTWNVDTDLIANVFLSVPGKEDIYCLVEPYEKGKFSITFDNLSPSTRYTVSIGYTVGEIAGRVRIRNINTHPSTPFSPYIFLYGIERNSDGSFPPGTAFPLRLYNACDAESVEWTLDGVTVCPDSSGYFVPQKSGMLEAVARYSDGSEYRVSKYLTIR